MDAFTGERHRSSLQDVADIATLADYLDAIAFHWTPVSAQDKPKETRSLHELHAIWNHSTKHVQTESIVNEREAIASVEMAAAVAGGRNELRRRLCFRTCNAQPVRSARTAAAWKLRW